MDDLTDQLRRVTSAFPGIRKSALDMHGRTISIQFEKSDRGRAADLVVDFVASVSKLTHDVADERATVSGGKRQLERFLEYFSYGSLLDLGSPREPERLTQPPLCVLLSHAYCGLTKKYRGDPNLGVWSNLLRVLDDQPVEIRHLPKAVILSRRALKATIQNAVEMSWVTVEPSPRSRRHKAVRLTAHGKRAKGEGRRLVGSIENEWTEKYGSAEIERFKASLRRIVSSLSLQLPHYLTGYGPADPQLTGGTHIPAELGPPRIPAHGAEWPIVRRSGEDDGDLGLVALLAQVLAAYTIDYEFERLGWLAPTTLFLRHFNEKTTLSDCEESGINGERKSLLERHLYVVVEPGKKRDLGRRVYLTPKGRAARDSYPALVREVERDWRKRYGARTIDDLRSFLKSLDGPYAAERDYPDTNRWFYRWWWPTNSPESR